MQRTIGLDIGEKRIGVAVSDPLGMMAHPLTTLTWKGLPELARTLRILLKEQNAGSIVVGLPLTMKGESSKKTEEVQKIINGLKNLLDVPIQEIDERLTTKMAERDLHLLNKKPSKNRDKIDQIAAVYILQTYLDKKKIL
jgi:putative Holliday junction resolvase